MASDFDDIETGVSKEAGGDTRLHATVSVDGAVTTAQLPQDGEVTIGRASTCDLVVAHGSVSRHHATLHLSPLEIVDVGSRNGTRVRGRRLSRGVPTSLAIGEAIRLGEAAILIHASSSDSLPDALPDHGRSPHPIDAECARSARSCSPFAVVQLALERDRPADVHEVLRATLRTSDVVRAEGGTALQVLLVDTGGDQVDLAVTRIANRLRERGIRARLGVARYPHDGVEADQLVAFAHEQLERPPGEPPTAMDGVREVIRQVATGELSVLISGETGVGKELCAEMIHRLSPRAARPFVKLNCSALVESLIESELFGHEKGAFTGATSSHEGLLEAGNGGTVFLDEIGELPLGMQAKLLRVLEQRVVRRVGAATERKVDVRFICATNRDLGEEVNGGRFRRDLYYRINGVTLAVPPLRERASEIVPLARAFANRARGGAPVTLGREVIAALEHHSWPGNIRELRNTIERAALLSSGGAIRPSHLVLEPARDSAVTIPVERMSSSTIPPKERTSSERISSPTLPPGDRSLASAVAELERQRILDALEQCGGNQTRAARLLGISRNTLLARLDEYGLPRPRK
ncbi:MAG: sigma 54-interacting transcriptional regulator [Acidobacteriota bacterium]